MKYTLIIILLTLLSIRTTNGQTDDVYYNPDKVVKLKSNPSSSNRLGSYRPETYSTDKTSFSDESNNYYDDYDFYYTSRIRRFHRPIQGFNFFNPYYIDMAYYDSFMRSATTMLIYDDFYSYRMFNRFNRWNNFNNFGGFNRWNSFGMNDPFSIGWNSPFSRFGEMGMNSFGWAGSQMMFMPFNNFIPMWGNGYGYNNFPQNNNNPVTPIDASNGHYGPRRGGGSVGPVPGIRNPDIGTVESSPRRNHPSTEYNRQRPSTTVQPRTSSDIRNDTERINRSTRGYESPSSSPSWSTPRNSPSPSIPSPSPSSGSRPTSSGGRIIN